ncbi:hypothetical protein [Phnomibacter ginsenosidimutans]|uniref:Lipoprotein n=1 Tax=Phnomibacter ginsenosidimutans TaxID=2676868 RepID=A0A6I6GAN8_9BACT|nr:hypothetical protein [Phnomibacter ginsenosidimutans]QGW27180.1 hypothetical protein GLV81_02840 [Phnomibacter ginsenosidimutans]
MKKMFDYTLLLMVACLLVACQSNQRTNTATTAKDSTVLITTGLGLEPDLAAADSISILFYKHPFTDDKEQYTRFYTSYQTTTDTVLTLLKENMAQPFTEDSLRDCRSEGKMFVYSKGKVAQTIYFTTQSAACTHLYFINTGRYYYFPFQAVLQQRLIALKTLAK